MAKVAKVAAPASLPSDSIHFCGAGAKVGALTKRKTPSELRGEQLKRQNTVEHVNDFATSIQNLNMVDLGVEKPDSTKATKYLGMRLDEVYPVKKPSSRLRLLAGKGTAKENKLVDENGGVKSSFPSNLSLKRHQESICFDDSATSSLNFKENGNCEQKTIGKANGSRFRSVTELSLGGDHSSDAATIDMDKALKGLVSREPFNSGSPADSSEKYGNLKSSGIIGPELHVPGSKIPLDFTLKTTMRIVSSSPVNRLHRLLMAGTYSASQLNCFNNKNTSSISRPSPFTVEVHGANSLKSWIYPQSSLPPAVISALSSATGAGEMDFLGKRQLTWEDSFRNLYYMLRKNACNIFYVCNSIFVVMFTATIDIGKNKRKCDAYISQSTRGLRSLLREHDICFSMPLCHCEVEQISNEDIELSEMEKHNLGQTKRLTSTYEVDNTPQSLLAFNGNESVHGLYDFLLNYKSFLTSLTGVDVPVLCSPVPFRHAAPSEPEVRCKEIKVSDHLATHLRSFTTKDAESVLGPPGVGVCYSIEVKDVCLPPWIVSSVCAAMASEGKSFQASFTTDPISTSLNAALDGISPNSDSKDCVEERSQLNNSPLDMEAVVTSDLREAWMKDLKYCIGSYTVSVLPI